MAQPSEKAARLLSDTEVRWCTVTAVNTGLGMSTSVTHSLKNTKEYNVYDSFPGKA